ncbi:MAG: hypothetical protein COS94_05795, partial [Candidatus Hydrogenedentes bacterium CG07_land_8_20_14_0_80_42_17]
MLTDCWYVIIFEIANWKVQIENLIFPIFIFQLFRTFFGRGKIASHLEAQAPRVNGRPASMDA